MWHVWMLLYDHVSNFKIFSIEGVEKLLLIFTVHFYLSTQLHVIAWIFMKEVGLNYIYYKPVQSNKCIASDYISTFVFKLLWSYLTLIGYLPEKSGFFCIIAFTPILLYGLQIHISFLFVCYVIQCNNDVPVFLSHDFLQFNDKINWILNTKKEEQLSQTYFF